MHKIAIAQSNLDRMKMRMGKLHPFDAIDPRKTALLVIDMQNYFVKQGHQSEVPLAARDRAEYQPACRGVAPPRRPRGLGPQQHHGHPGKLVQLPRYLQKPERAERRLKSMDIGEDGYDYWHLQRYPARRTRRSPRNAIALSFKAHPTSSGICATAASIRC